MIFYIRFTQNTSLWSKLFCTEQCAFLYFLLKILYFLRYSSRSERSDYEREYRNTPPRDNRRRSSRDEDFPGSGRDYAHDYSRRDKRNDRVKERHGKKKVLSLGINADFGF